MLVLVGRRFQEQYFWHQAAPPYVVFIAEFFLRRSNRTTVERHLPAFLSRFPTIDSLAAADPGCVVDAASWAGLRKRTAHLPEVARELRSRRCWNAESLLKLPYIGRYAADSIALYGYGEPRFPVDNNVRRVFSRYFAIDGDDVVADVAGHVLSVAVSEGGVEGARAAHRGVLALGWENCKTAPRCASCPLRISCRGAQRETGGTMPDQDTTGQP